MESYPSPTGLLLVGHGTRSEVGVGQFLELARRLAERFEERRDHPHPNPLPKGEGTIAQDVPQIWVEPAFLELQQPHIETAVARLVARDVERLVTMPMLLFAAGHAKKDIPRAVKAALGRVGAERVECFQAGHLGCHPSLVELSERRMWEAVGALRDGGQSPPYVLLVGRGSNDETATAEMREFARLRAERVSGSKVEVAFLAMARPLLRDELARIARDGLRQVVVQPHLLFHGDLIDSVSDQVTEVAGAHPETEWILAPPLADRPGEVGLGTQLIESAILERIAAGGVISN